MNCHEIASENDCSCHVGKYRLDTQMMSDSILIPNSLFMLSELETKRNIRKRTNNNSVSTILPIKPTGIPNASRKRQRRVLENQGDYEQQFHLNDPNNSIFQNSHTKEHATPIRRISSSSIHSLIEQQTTLRMSPAKSVVSLCSTSSTNSFAEQQDQQHSYFIGRSKAKYNTERLLVEAIREEFLPMLKDTRLCPNTHSIRSLRSRDVALAQSSILGVGTFSQVTKVVLRNSDGTNRSDNQQYACKQLRQELLSNVEDFVKAASELSYEAFVLSSFDHPNIIKLRGLPEDGVSSFGNAANDTLECHKLTSSRDAAPPATSFFLIMDVLEETLDQRIERWNTIDQPRTILESRQRTIEKVSLCQQLASVLEHIHSKGVVFRDLKPQNIGFCDKEGGILKLFDFGLSRELPLSTVDAVNEHMRFDLSGMVGTIRYMAPEVCLSQPYNRDCDIFSWSIVAWEIFSQKKPFQTFTPDLYKSLVCKQGYRPTDDYTAANLPHEVAAVLKGAWKHEPHLRLRWQGIQGLLDVFQKSEELRLRESIREEAAASIAAFDDRFTFDSTKINPIRHPGPMDNALNSPWTNRNGIGEYPSKATGMIHLNDVPRKPMLLPTSWRSPWFSSSVATPMMRTETLDPRMYLRGN